MLKKRLAVFMLAAIVISLTGLFFLKGRKEMVDFEVNYLAGKRIRMGETLYRQTDGHYQFKYPPSSALLYAPLSCLPLDTAKTVWFFVVLSSSVLIFNLCLKIVEPERHPAWTLRVLPPLILAKFFLRELQLGQINALLTVLLLAVSLWIVENPAARSKSRAWISGATWGATAALKPYALIFLPYFILKKNVRLLAAGLLFLFLAGSAPALFYGIPGNLKVYKEWISSLSQSTPSLLASQDNISLIALFMKWSGRPDLSWKLYFTAVALLALLFFFLMFKGHRGKRPEALECALLLVFIPLVSPLGWDYTLLSSALAVVIVVAHFRSFTTFWKVLSVLNFIVIGLALYDLMGRSLYAEFMALSVPTLNMLILSGGLIRLRMREIA